MTDFSQTKAQFQLPEGLTYLDGNSLGPLPLAAEARMAEVLRAEWGGMLIGGWNKAGWMEMPERLGDRVGRLIGAPAGSVMVGETLSIRLFQALAAALSLRPERKVILTDNGNFPSDLYVAQGLIRALGQGHELRVVDSQDVEAAISDEIAVLMLTEVDYRTGRLHDMAHLSKVARDAGVVTLWDLAHSAGALPVDLTAACADFAVGCTYKYLNGGPGAPAFIHVAPALQARVEPVLSGWLGHAAPFDFEPDYRPGTGIARMRVGTPPVLAMAVLETALDIWDGVGMEDVRARSMALSEMFIAEVEKRCPELILASPRDPKQRGSQVSFRHAEGYAVMQALIERGVIGDFRAPDIIRFGITPLYIGEAEIRCAAEVLEEVLRERLWDNEAYRKRARVT